MVCPLPLLPLMPQVLLGASEVFWVPSDRMGVLGVFWGLSSGCSPLRESWDYSELSDCLVFGFFFL